MNKPSGSKRKLNNAFNTPLNTELIKLNNITSELNNIEFRIIPEMNIDDMTDKIENLQREEQSEMRNRYLSLLFRKLEELLHGLTEQQLFKMTMNRDGKYLSIRSTIFKVLEIKDPH